MIREARREESRDCATILNDWIDTTDWMPRIHDRNDVERHYRETVFPKRRVFVFGDPIEGYVSIDEGEGFVMALYARNPGQGVGKRLIDHAKARYPVLNLWTFVANSGARRFYEREGFVEVERSDGDNEEKLPDIRYRWELGA